MNPDNIVEYNSLSWVKKQLDDVLSDAQSDLNEFIENKTDENLENCIEHLQLVYGTLQMVEIYGAAMLAEEMRLTTEALLKGDVERAEDTYDVLMRAMLQLPDYLEGIQAGKKDSPITLMSLFNDLRTARKEGLLSESVLFSPDLENAEISSDVYDVDAIEAGKLQGEVKRLRTHYQLGLLDYIRNNKERAGLQRIKAVLSSLEKASSNVEVRHIWMVVGALVEGLMKHGINTNMSIKTLLGAVDRQLKQILDDGEELYAKMYSAELVKNVLYYVGLSTVDSELICAVKEAYHLDGLIPKESDGADQMIGGLNADLFDTVSKGITEDLVKVKDILELFMQSSDQDLQVLDPVAEQLGKIADTYGMLGLGNVRQSIMDQRDLMKTIIKGDAEISEQTVSAIAYELLRAESELKDFISSRSGFVNMVRESEDQIVPASEYRQVVFAVMTEGLKNFSQAKEAVLSYLSGIGNKEQLELILNRLEEVRGVSMMLPLGRIESQIERLQQYIRVALLENNHQPDAQEQDTVADVVVSIEYFFEALSEGRPGVVQGLNAGDEAANILQDISLSYGDSAVEIIDQDVVEISRDEEFDISETFVVEENNDVIPVHNDSVFSPVEKPQDVNEYAILGDEADEEIVEIFIEEAIEVLGELHNYLPKWKLDYDDDESLAVLRRSFHTLKGSGRLLGADLIGEFSWKFENLLNRIIDNKISVSEPLWHAMDEALAVLPQLIEQLKGNREPIDNISQLMATADTLAEGGDVSVEREVNKQEASVENLDNEPAIFSGDEFNGDEFNKIDNVSTGDSIEDIPAIDSPILSASDTHEDENYDDVVEVIAIDLDSSEKDTAEIVITADDEELTIEELSTDDFEEERISISEISNDSDIDEPITSIASAAIEDDEFDIELTSDTGEQSESQDNAVIYEELQGLELIDISEDYDDTSLTEDNEYSIEIEELESNVVSSEGKLDLDPVLLKIYFDESQSHVKTIRQLLDDCDINNQLLQADKTLIRAFHTLYGSARTAEVEAIAEICGAAEKYVKARQDSGEENIPTEVSTVFREIEQAISAMLVSVEEGLFPVHNKELQEKINKVIKKEIQSQLQKSWHDDSLTDDVTSSLVSDIECPEAVATQADNKSNVVSIDMSELAPDTELDDDFDGDIEAYNIADEEPVTLKVRQIVAEETVAMSYSDIDAELIDIFLEEADELLESCENTLREIIKTPNSTEQIHQLQRNMHTLKGGARMADLAPVGDLTHNLESLVVMVAESKVDADKVLFGLLQESLDALTNMLASVKKREAVATANNLNKRIEMLMRGEAEEKRSAERFDVELSELESTDDEELEDVDISKLLLIIEDDNDIEKITIEESAQDDNERTLDQVKEKPHWGERATDVNFKESQEQVRVRSDLLNNLVNYAGEVNIHHARMGKQISDIGYNLSELNQTVIRLKEQLRKLEIETEIQIRSGYEKESDNFDDNFDPLEMDQYSTMQQLTRSLGETAADVESINDILSEITRDSETLLIQESRISTDLQEGLMRTRMVRFGGLSSRLRRIVRQISRELGKEVDIDIVGENSEVDRTVLDRIIAPLEHMLRNAVAHGIELPEVRKALGKNETGKISIEVKRQGPNVVIIVKDDGVGINVDKIRAKAIEQDFITETSNLSDYDALQFILKSGFSTADEVTQVSGRGVGMDVVDSEIKQLGGVLTIDTRHGKGTEFNIRLPLTLAINQALLVSVADDVFAVPLASIEGVVRITGLELQRFYDSENSYYEFNGVEYELKHLGGLLTGKQSDYSKQLQLFPVLLVNVGVQHFALHVDDLLGRREIVVKPVGLQIGGVRGIAGATILADGRVVLILEMSALVVADSLFKVHVPVAEVAKPVIISNKTTVMVVDDSITIRKVTERMLLRYGIEVMLAKDGVDATSQLQEMMPDLMLLDIEMPRMDGFEVASFVRSDERLKHLPIIMITSRTGAKHKEKAMEIGVDRYLGKPFQEEDLVKNINEILNTSFSNKS